MFRPNLKVTRQFQHNPRSLVNADPDDFSLPNPGSHDGLELEIELAHDETFGNRIAYTFHGSYRVHFPACALEGLDIKEMRTLNSNKSKVRCLCSLLDQKLHHTWNSSRESNTLRHWIFTPSFIGRSTITQKFLYRRSCFPNLELFRGYIQVLVVRPEQFGDYRSYFGREYIILSMPPKLQSIDKRGFTETSFEFTPESAGCGYARLFIQRFALQQQLTAVWMIDDNVNACYQLDGLDQSDNAKKSFTNASFFTVMQHIEFALDSSNASGHSSEIIKPLEEELLKHSKYGKIPEVLLRGNGSRWEEMKFGPAEVIQDYAPTGHHIGIIGCGRCAMLRNETIAEPIKVTHSVYSFFLFNVAAATKRDLFYPPRRTMEDIEMSYMMEEAGLVVCKLQAFSHTKPVRALSNQPKSYSIILEHLSQLKLPEPTALYHHGENPDNPLMMKMANQLIRKLKYRVWEGEEEETHMEPAQSLVVLMHKPLPRLFKKRASFVGTAYGAVCRLSSTGAFEALLDPSLVVYVHGVEEINQVVENSGAQEALEGLIVERDQGLMIVSTYNSVSMGSTPRDSSTRDDRMLLGMRTPRSPRQTGTLSPQKAVGRKRKREDEAWEYESATKQR